MFCQHFDISNCVVSFYLQCDVRRGVINYKGCRYVPEKPFILYKADDQWERQQEPMSYFSVPLSDDKTTRRISKLVKKSRATIKRGIAACTKSVLSSERGLLVIAADVTPEDLVSYMPPLAEEHRVPYIFVQSMRDLCESNEYMKPTTCCFICEKDVEKETMDKIMKKAFLY